MPQQIVSPQAKRLAGDIFYPTSPFDAQSYTAEEVIDNFGVIGTQGTLTGEHNGSILAGGSVGAPLGVILNSTVQMRDDGSKVIEQGYAVSVLQDGYAVVKADTVGAALVRGDLVYYRTDTAAEPNGVKGALTDGTTPNAISFPQAKVWHAAVDGLAVIRIKGQ